MAVAGPIQVGDVLDQPTGTLQNAGDGVTGQVVRQGRYGALETYAFSLNVKAINNLGTEQAPENWYVASWALERLEGDYGRLTINIGDTADNTSGQTEPDNVVSEKWSLKNVQMQLPLSRFYIDGTWSGTAPDGHQIALWRQEPRKDLYDAYQFLAPDGNIYELSDGSKAAADKYRKGIESVMRFYPVVTRTITYKKGMSDDRISALKIGEKLAHIQTPAKTFGLAPGTWLCIQDEADLAADGTFVRVTGWMGCKSLDKDLYGDTDRWEPMDDPPSS